MHFNTLIAASILAASASATAPEGMPYKLAAKSLNPAYGLVKRQSGYQPSQTFCSGYGDCAEACGTGYETCASTDGSLHCFDPTAKETCCPTGTGDSCSEGYYCTQATDLTVWCCPDGMDLTACAAIYSLTGVLQSVAPSSIASASSVPTTHASVTTSDILSLPAYTTSTTSPVGSHGATKTGGGSNVTLTGSSTATATQAAFTGMAGRILGVDGWVGGCMLVAVVGMGVLL
ncbi:hypothetical protein SBOR_1081 [Sclerotinia borealis F-4128]|uniref:Prp 4 CRoW domain-containing protein n=1 Tax=Sclerotinia borealis (strain F-4128) TaxID=1432307 RepID=W9CVB4_SCLBF|nr:hypothetical protein SBOR_1081 [Sclerotinia borealis F-4128]